MKKKRESGMSSEVRKFFEEMFRELMPSSGHEELRFFSPLLEAGCFPSIESVIHKLRCLRYHLDNYIKLEEKYLKIARKYSKYEIYFKDEILRDMPIAFTPNEPIYEFEAFCFQMKACLDIFSKSVGLHFNEKPSNISKLKKVLKQKKNPSAKRILDILNENEWLKEYKSTEIKKTIRDIIAHYSKLRVSGMWIISEMYSKEKRLNWLMHEEKPLRRIMEEHYSNLLNLIKQVYEILFAEYLYHE